jgi:hypothetical protein
MLFRHEPGTLPLQSLAPPVASAIERPPPGLARGTYPASPWLIFALGVTLLLGIILYFSFRKPRP